MSSPANHPADVSTAVSSAGVASPKHNKRPKTKGPKVSGEAMDDAISAVLSQPSSNDTTDSDNSPMMSMMQSQVDQLQSVVASQAAEITRLTQQLTFVMSYLEITDCNHGAKGSVESAVNDGSSGGSSGQPIPSSNAAQNQNRSHGVSSARPLTARAAAVSAAVTAVYVEQSVKKKRASTISVSGLPVSNSSPDKQLVSELCQGHLSLQPDVVHTKRLGPVRSGRVQPLLVALRTDDDARQLLTRARQLRQSSDNFVRQNVYINPNLTRAEANAAYQLREHRRLRTQAASTSSTVAAAASAAEEGQQTSANPHAAGTAAVNPASNSAQTQLQTSSLNPVAPSFNPVDSQ